MWSVRKLADASSDASLSNTFRQKRFKLFEELVRSQKQLRILDVGGTELFWKNNGWAGRDGVEITAVNLEAKPTTAPNIQVVKGDATSLEYADNSFDVAFSNSVIEHLFTFENQRKMAVEMQRVAKAHWVQTPNFWFPMEPHFHKIGWQWLPRFVRIAILRRFRCGWRGPCPDRALAGSQVDEVKLLSYRQMRQLFPNSNIVQEKFCGFSKSFIAHGGFPKLSST